MVAKNALAGLLLLAAGIAQAGDSIQVSVEAGTLAGDSNGTIQIFRGIPYAAPPVGPLRWSPPQPVPHWTGTREATKFGAACPQASVPDLIDGASGRLSEDCLTLNIWAPAHAATPLPVMLWLHGGGNTQGAGSKRYYDGTSFARDGVILVTINYRLGVLGFFAHPALKMEANFGVLDQIAALDWVRRNIRAFGGDPRNLTLFGESAGGQDAMALIACPLAAGLFRRAIVESAGWWMHLPTLAEAETDSIQMVGKLGLPASPTAEELRALPADAFVTAGLEGEGLFVDGRTVPVQPESAFSRGTQAHVPLMIGWNSDEASLMNGSGMNPSALLAQARPIYEAGTDDSALARALFRDEHFAAPSRWAARETAAQTYVYLYRFSYIRERQLGKLPGAPHGSEVPYVFDSWGQSPGAGRFLAQRDLAEANTVHACWVAFAKTGRPSCQGAPAWPVYRTEDDELLDFGSTAVVRRGLDARQLDFMQAYILRKDGLSIPERSR